MPNRPPSYRPPGSRQRQQAAAAASDAARGTAAQRGYGSRWQRARLSFLAEHPLCVDCKAAGKVTAADTVDHRVPHKGDTTLFWDVSNWEACCASCHSRRTMKYDGGGGNEVRPKPSNMQGD
jgi:5-methylcytosine-specific restriction protein A